jgi:hypothetical protein
MIFPNDICETPPGGALIVIRVSRRESACSKKRSGIVVAKFSGASRRGVATRIVERTLRSLECFGSRLQRRPRSDFILS